MNDTTKLVPIEKRDIPGMHDNRHDEWAHDKMREFMAMDARYVHVQDIPWDEFSVKETTVIQVLRACCIPRGIKVHWSGKTRELYLLKEGKKWATDATTATA